MVSKITRKIRDLPSNSQKISHALSSFLRLYQLSILLRLLGKFSDNTEAHRGSQKLEPEISLSLSLGRKRFEKKMGKIEGFQAHIFIYSNFLFSLPTCHNLIWPLKSKKSVFCHFVFSLQKFIYCPSYQSNSKSKSHCFLPFSTNSKIRWKDIISFICQILFVCQPFT